MGGDEMREQKRKGKRKMWQNGTRTRNTNKERDRPEGEEGSDGDGRDGEELKEAELIRK
jgi:hypothetical protein